VKNVILESDVGHFPWEVLGEGDYEPENPVLVEA